MRRSYRNGLRAALAHWRLVLFVFFASFLGGLVAMGCSWLWLASALDGSLATRTLATSLDVNVFIDLVANHGETLRVFALVAALLTLFGILVWVGVNAVIISWVGNRGADTRRSSLRKYLAFLCLWAVAMVAYAAVIGAAYLGEHFLAAWTAHPPDDVAYYGALTAMGVPVLLALLVIATVHDHARIRYVETGDTAWRAGLWACAYVAGQPRALLLTTALVATSVAVWGVYQAGAWWIPADNAPGLSVSLILAQTFMAARALVRVWTFAAATDLQSVWESA